MMHQGEIGETVEEEEVGGQMRKRRDIELR